MRSDHVIRIAPRGSGWAVVVSCDGETENAITAPTPHVAARLAQEIAERTEWPFVGFLSEAVRHV